MGITNALFIITLMLEEEKQIKITIEHADKSKKRPFHFMIKI